MKLIYTFLLLLSAPSLALKSPFPSQVLGLDTPNSHQLDDQGLLFRGMTPNAKEWDQLKNLGVKKVLIFKRETRNEIHGKGKEIDQLRARGFDYKYIPFQWKDLDFEQSCLQTLEALEYLRAANLNGESVFFHCTVGEDRTGVLSGLHRVLFEGLPAEKVFRDEMCARGYADGNPEKGRMVVEQIHAGLTPFFFAMAATFSGATELRPEMCKKLHKPKSHSLSCN